MYKHKIVLFFLLLFVCIFSSNVFSQIVASQTTGCVPLQVNFTAPIGAVSANWNFGNGTSNQINPSNVYNTPGTYVVSYTGTGGSPTSGNITIVVAPNNINPTINFTIPPSHCAPMTVNFTGSSANGTLFQWAFGDGGIGQGANINHAYTLGGIFNATLAVTDPVTNCTGTVTNGPINVSLLPNVFIDASPGFNSCFAPFTTAFTGTNSSSGSPFGPALTYNWNFGNSQTSTQPTPGNITYNNLGTYNVVLSVTDDNFCTNTKTEVVTMVQPVLTVTVPPSICVLGQEPFNPCPTPCFIVNYSSNQPNVVFQMGDGNTVIQPPQSGSFSYPRYSTPGLKTLTITATIGSCVATVTKTIFVEQIVPQFTFTPASYTCSPTMVVSYINQSTVNSGSPMSYTWIVTHWDGLPANAYSSTATHPTFTVAQGSKNPYTWFGLRYGIKTMLRVETSTLQCWAEIQHVYDSIRRPTAWFNKDKKQGCAPLTVRFRDSSNTNPNIFPIQSYTWNNGAVPAQYLSGTVPPAINNPTFTYASPGTYTPYLIIQTVGGCIDTSYIDTIIVVNRPTVSYTFNPLLQVCAGQNLQVNMSALPADSVIQHWHAGSDDGYFSGCVNNPNPIWFFTHLGQRTFTISAYDHGCKSEVVAIDTITVKGPMAKGCFRTNCTNRTSVKFFSDVRGAEGATLDFGDASSPHVIVGNPAGNVMDSVTHVYPATGDYSAILTATNSLTNCGPFRDTMFVKVRNVQASLTVQPIICDKGAVTYSALGSVDVYTTCSRGYAWFLDTLAPAQSPSPTFLPCDPNSIVPSPYCLLTPGIHTITLWVRDINSCTDTVTKTFLLDMPKPSFSVAANPACVSDMPVQFVNTTSQSPIAANSFTWDFGTGPPATATLATNPVSVWPIKNYTATTPFQTYTVTLTSRSDLFGCLATDTMILQVNHPQEPGLWPYTPLACVGNTINFNLAPDDTVSINFGDTTALVVVTTGTQVSHTYTAPGIYEPVITFTDPDGCSSTDTAWVSVQSAPVADFTFFPTLNPNSTGNVFCAPVSLTFSNTSVSSFPTSFYWYLDQGSSIIDSSVVGTLYTSPGIKTVTLTVSTKPNGCRATVIHSLTVLSTTATAVINKTELCLGETIRLSMKDTVDVFGWNWYFGDGVTTGTVLAGPLATQTVSYPYTYYPPPFGNTVVNLVYFSTDYLCPHTSTIGIKVTRVDADFKRNDELAVLDSVHCLNITDLFTNMSKINNSGFITGLYFNWDFGDGATSPSLSTSYTYPVPGMYTVTLKVTDPQAGCVDVSVKNMTINPLPTVSIASIDSVCSGIGFILTSNPSPDVSKFQWMPVAGVSSPNTSTTGVTATVSTTYSLWVTNIYGCEAKSSNDHYVYVQQPAPIIRWDTTVIIGQSSAMNVNFGSSYTYTWSPVTDLSCEHCPYATSTTTTNITYSVEAEDMMGCFRTTHTYSVYVDPITSIDVPTAFTPNGDGVNDVIYVDGWGIKKLNYFRIFNRWGQLLFESYDIKVGWDGTYLGVPQNMETYVYQASAEGYLPGTLMNKTSSFRLIR